MRRRGKFDPSDFTGPAFDENTPSPILDAPATLKALVAIVFGRYLIFHPTPAARSKSAAASLGPQCRSLSPTFRRRCERHGSHGGDHHVGGEWWRRAPRVQKKRPPKVSPKKKRKKS